MSTLTDLKRCFATFANLFSSVSTQGVGVNQITAADCGSRSKLETLIEKRLR